MFNTLEIVHNTPDSSFTGGGQFFLLFHIFVAISLTSTNSQL